MMAGRVIFICLPWRGLCWGWCVAVKGSCPQLLKRHFVVDTILITSVEELLDYLYLPLNEVMTS